MGLAWWPLLALALVRVASGSRLDSLLQWVENTDIQMSGVGLKDFGGTQGIGLVATKELVPGDTLVKVPMDIVLRFVLVSQWSVHHDNEHSECNPSSPFVWCLSHSVGVPAYHSNLLLSSWLLLTGKVQEWCKLAKSERS